MKILFITSATHLPYLRNMNHFQRVYFLSRETELHIFCGRSADFTLSAAPATTLHRAGSDSTAGFLLSALVWMLRHGRKQGFDIVLTEPSIMAIAGWFAKMVSDTKWVVDVWDIPIRGRSRTLIGNTSRFLKRLIVRHAFRKADLFILSIIPDFEFAFFNVPKEKRVEFPNAIWLEDTLRHKGSTRGQRPFELLVMRGTFCADSGLDTVAQAFARLRATHDDITLTIVGRLDPIVLAQLKPIASDPNVTLVPFMEHEELMGRIADAAACLIPYKPVADLSQIYPIKLLEYLALGSVVIASDLPNMRRVITDGENGLLFDPRDSADLVRKVELIYSDRELARRLAKNAEALGAGFDCRKKNERVIQCLREVSNI